MFRRVYKSANDDIVPDSGLLEEILAKSRVPQKKHKSFYGYGSLAACLFIAIGTLAIYPTIKEDFSTSKNNSAQDVVVSTSSSIFPDSEISPALKPDETAESDGVQSKEASTEQTVTQKPAKKEESQKKKTQPEKTEAVGQSAKDSGKKQEQTKNQEVKKTQQQEKAATSVESLNPSSPSPTKQPAVQSESSENRNAVSEEISHGEYAPASASANTSDSEAAYTEDSAESDVQITKSAASGGASGGGGGSSSAFAGRQTPEQISEALAKQIANNIFASDFGQEFLNSSDILADYSGYYTITRYTESASYSIIVYDNGTTKKLY